MENEKREVSPEDPQHKDAAVKPEPETLHTTDPQEHMEGPISSLIRKAGEGFKTEKSKDEADDEKEKDM